MDEILIEEKKYVSSKRAAKMTGYAKDYIGQLCREGRVPARLIGRGWYVLESAIQDHRFGNPEPEIELVQKEGKAVEKTSETISTLESPRYEASAEEPLTVMNRLKDTEQIQDSWKAWFDRFDHVADPDKSGSAADAEPSKDTADVIEPVIQEIKEEEQQVETEEEEPVPIIHTVSRPLYRPPPGEFLPHNIVHLEAELPIKQPSTQRKSNNKGVLRTIQVVGAVAAIAVAATAVIGSGYFDKYAILNSRVMMIAGVGLYNK